MAHGAATTLDRMNLGEHANRLRDRAEGAEPIGNLETAKGAIGLAERNDQVAAVGVDITDDTGGDFALTQL